VRQIVFENDPLHAFGDMRRVQAPAGDLLWVCCGSARRITRSTTPASRLSREAGKAAGRR